MTEPGAGTTESVEKIDGSVTTTYASGTRLEVVHGPDPRFGMQAPIVASVKSRTPGGKESTASGRRVVELADPTDLLSLVRQTDTVTVNGRTSRSEYEAATRKLTTTSAGGRSTVKTFDVDGRLVQLEPGAGMTPASFSYTPEGRLEQASQGARSITYAYDARGRVASKADAAGTTTYAYDAADRVTTATLPGGREYGFAYDANGRRASVTLPSGAVHAFTYSPAGDLTGFTPAGSAPYARTLTSERELSRVTLPGGREQAYARDDAGRLTGIAYDEATIGFSNDDTGRVTGLSWAEDAGASQQTALAYDGEIVSTATSTGAAPGAYAYEYDNNLRLVGMRLDSEPKTTLSRDGDGLLTAVGPFSFTRGGGAGRVSRISDGTRRADFTYDAAGRVTSRTYWHGAAAVYAIELDYDAADRVTERRERRGGGAPKTTTYTYDAAGRLESVRVDGTLTESYGYTADGDRTARRLPDGSTETGIYDARGLLDRRGGVEYTFDGDGFMTARGSTQFTYGARGELLGAETAAGEVSYAYDATGRRVSRTAGGTETEYLYGNPESAFQVTATRGPGGLTTYFYDDAGHVFAFERAAERYQVATDQSGSATTITNAAGTVVKSVAYDSFGNELSDSDPSFAYPFGFAGGLADDATGLVRFGLRDYDPEAGRWTARDPSLVSGLDGNLYAYVGNDPVNRSDPAGLFSVGLSAYGGVGGGLRLTFTREGFSWCGELGFGVGVTAEIDPMSDLDKETIGLFGEVKADVLGIASVRGKAEVTNPCGTGPGPSDGDYDVSFKPEACLAFVCTNGDNVKGKGDPRKLAPKFKPEIGVSAKAGTKACAQVKW